MGHAHRQVLCGALVCLALAVTPGTRAAEPALAPATAKAASGVALSEALQTNVELEDSKQMAAPLAAQILKSEPVAQIANGIGDISTIGPCQEELDSWCMDVKPGESRLARCIADQLAEEAKPGYKGPAASAACKANLEQFQQDLADNINRDLPLAMACKADAEKLCTSPTEGQSVLACLRENKDKLSAGCVEEVFKRQQVAANNWKTDKELRQACEADVTNNCPNVEAEGGLVQECLAEKRAVLSWDCQEQLFRQEVQNADDLRLSVRLFRACLADKKQFCADVPPGNARAKECLEDHREAPGFSKECKSEIEKMMSDRAADFRLDPKLRQLCEQDIHEICGYERESMDSTLGYDARVIQCLQDYREEIRMPACAARVQKIMEYASSDIRFDVPLADACYEDRNTFCSNVTPGSARVIRCLQDRRQELTYECKALLFDEEVRMAESIDFQYPMKKACGADIPRFCPNVARNHAKVIRCLQEHLDDPGLTPGCKQEVEKHVEGAAHDYRLNYRLSLACHDTIAEQCADACPSASMEEPCGGTVLRCLQDKVDDIADAECKKEVFYFVKMEVADFRNDVILAEACHADVEKLCASKPRGEVHQCLRDNKDKLSEACRKEETSLAIVESTNTELMPNLARACKVERKKHCHSVRAGKARVFSCLLLHAERGDYSVDCREQLARQQERRVKDWRLDYDLRMACREDVPKVCAGARAQEDKGTAAVLKCLVSANETVAEKCGREVGRAVRNALQFYAPQRPVTDACDADVTALCLQDQGLKQYGIGQVRKCLASQIAEPALPPAAGTSAATSQPVESNLLPGMRPSTGRRRGLLVAGTTPKAETKLSPACLAVVRLAEPVDLYRAYNSALTVSAVAAHVKGLENKLGFPEGTLTPKDTGGFLTLSGWVAMLGIFSIVAVTSWAAVLAYRRYMGYDQMSTYTMIVKQGQVAT